MNSVAKLALGLGGAIALGGGIYFGSRAPSREVGILSITAQPSAVKVVKTSQGKQIRIVTDHAVADQAETEFGQASVIEEKEGAIDVPNTALCNVVFLAEVETVDGKQQPKIDGLHNYLNAGATPVLIRLDDEGNGIWNCLFRGNDCVWAAENLDYIGSDIQQFVNHPKRNFLLRTFAKPGAVDNDGNLKSIVDLDDIDADPNAEVFFNNEWAGMPTVNFSVYKDGKVIPAAEKAVQK